MSTVGVIVGRLVKAHGVHGDLIVELSTDEPRRRFAAGATVFVEASGRSLTVASARPQGGRWAVHFVSCDDRNAAEALVGAVLVARVPADEKPADDDEYYVRQLVGLVARLPDGREAGRVTDVMQNAAQDLLVIDTPDGERLVPFVGALVPHVDIEAGSLTIADMPGLLDDAGDG